jgi:hypothetical protein
MLRNLKGDMEVYVGIECIVSIFFGGATMVGVFLYW